MKNKIHQLFFTLFMFVASGLLTTVMIKPFSMIFLLGVSAAFASALIILGGIRQVFIVILGTIVVHLILHFYFLISFNLPVFFISALAICAQGIWAKKLTEHIVVNGQWLDSRKNSSAFIYRIGPLASLISAVASILITILSVKSFDINLVYVFCRTWSVSILTSIFVIPLVLFFNNDPPFNKGKKLFVIAGSILGGFSIALLFKVGHERQQYFRTDDFNKVKVVVQAQLTQELMVIEQQLNALKAYFESSNRVTLAQFNEFSAHILNNKSKIESFEWAPFVEEEQRNTYEQKMSKILDTHFIISQQTIMGNNIRANEGSLYLPVQYVFPRYQNEHILGLDLFSHFNKKTAVNTAIKTGTPTATLPINIIKGDFSNPAIYIVLPIFNRNLKPLFGQFNKKGGSSVYGVVVAEVRLSTLFKQTMDYVEENKINFFIKDVHNNRFFTVAGHDVDKNNRLTSQTTIRAFSRDWSYELSEENTWIIHYKEWQVWAILFGGTFGGLVFQLLILMMAAYSTELRNRVTQKTRELILSKEKSDNENQAKTDFLQSLSIELKVPLNVIKRLVEVFPKNKLLDKDRSYVENILSATVNLEQLIDTLNELSAIESGRLIVNIQSFDFILFLKRMEDIVETQTNNMSFIIQEDVPQFIESDELRLQQVFVACAENARDILDANNISIAVKVHFHHQNSATIVFVLHALKSNDAFKENTVQISKKKKNRKFNLRMEMAKELCNKLGGNINIALLPSGEPMLHLSVKVKISQEQKQGLGRFNIPSIEQLSVLDIKRVLFIEGKSKENKNLYRQLLSLKYHVDVISHVSKLENILFVNKYHLIVFDCSESYIDINDIPTPLKIPFSKITTLALFNDTLDDKMLSLVNYKFTAYVVLPITTDNLRGLLNNYVG